MFRTINQQSPTTTTTTTTRTRNPCLHESVHWYIHHGPTWNVQSRTTSLRSALPWNALVDDDRGSLPSGSRWGQKWRCSAQRSVFSCHCHSYYIDAELRYVELQISHGCNIVVFGLEDHVRFRYCKWFTWRLYLPTQNRESEALWTLCWVGARYRNIFNKVQTWIICILVNISLVLLFYNLNNQQIRGSDKGVSPFHKRTLLKRLHPLEALPRGYSEASLVFSTSVQVEGSHGVMNVLRHTLDGVEAEEWACGSCVEMYMFGYMYLCIYIYTAMYYSTLYYIILCYIIVYTCLYVKNTRYVYIYNLKDWNSLTRFEFSSLSSRPMKNPRVFPSSPEVQVSMHDVLGMDVHPEGFSGGLDPSDWLDYRWGSGPSCNPSTICKKTWQASLSSIWPQIPIELTVTLGCSIREWPNPWTYQSVVTQGIEITARSTRSCSLSSLLFWMQELSILPKMWDICASTIRSGFELSTFSFILSLQATWLQWQRKHPTEQLRFADIFQVTIWHLQQIFTQISSKLCHVGGKLL